jgi:hypothetical protein
MIGATVRVSRLRFTALKRREPSSQLIMQVGGFALARGNRPFSMYAARFSQNYDQLPNHSDPRVRRVFPVGFAGEEGIMALTQSGKWCFDLPAIDPVTLDIQRPFPVVDWDFHGQIVTCNGLFLRTANDDATLPFRQPVSWTLDGLVVWGTSRQWMRLIDARDVVPPLLNNRWYNGLGNEEFNLTAVNFAPFPFRPTPLSAASGAFLAPSPRYSAASLTVRARAFMPGRGALNPTLPLGR